MFDEVDMQDRPTGTVISKAQAHEQGLPHRCAAVYVFTDAGELYVQLHKKYQMFDHSVGGHVEAGEDYETAAYREAEEELGIAGVKFEEIGTGVLEHFPSQNPFIHFMGIYSVQAPAGWKFVPNDEVDAIEPRSLEAIVADMQAGPKAYTPGFLTTMHFYLGKKRPELLFDLPAVQQAWIKAG